ATISSALCFFWGIPTSSYGSIAYFREDHFSGGRPIYRLAFSERCHRRRQLGADAVAERTGVARRTSGLSSRSGCAQPLQGRHSAAQRRASRRTLPLAVAEVKPLPASPFLGVFDLPYSNRRVQAFSCVHLSWGYGAGTACEHVTA